MKRDPRDTPVFQDCLRLYIEYGGKEIVEIEREMRRLGTRFGRFLKPMFRGNYPDAVEAYD